MSNTDVKKWFPMRVTYGRIERMMRMEQLLKAEQIECFLPVRYEFKKTEDWDVRKELVPAINGLIFVHASQEELTNLKMTRADFEPLRYTTNHLATSVDDRLLTVPDREMENFMKVASIQDDRVVFLDYNEFIAQPGKRVMVTDGDFAGAVGTIKRIKKSQCVVVQVEGVAAVAITFVPKAWLQELSDEDYQEKLAGDIRG